MMIVRLSLIILLGDITGGSDFVEIDDQCLPLVGENCMKDIDCQVSNTYCNGVCTCHEGLKPSEDKTFCENNQKSKYSDARWR